MKIKSIHQFLPVLARYDAIGETVLRIQKIFHQWGYNSDIFVETPIEQTSNMTKKYLDYQEKNLDVIIYHHSIGSALADFTSKLKVPKILFYHNVTPPKFFEPYNKTITSELYKGRQQTENLAKYFEFAMAASNYNKYELRQAGFKQVYSLHYFIDLERFDNFKIKEDIFKKYSKSKNILFVGRRSPNKKIEDILKVFAFFKIFNPNSFLFVLGGSWSVEEYAKTLEELLITLHIKDNVVFVNTLTDEELASFYTISDVFLCMSEHEGFCIPLVEAMYFGLPIVAYNSSAVPDTLGGSGILLNHKKYDEIAELISILINNKNLSEKIISLEKERVKSFSMQEASNLLKKTMTDIIQKLES